MKRLTALLLAMILCLSLEACSMKTDLVPDSQETHTQETSQEETEETNPESSSAAQEETTDAMEEPIPLNLELIGPWHLDQNKNDLASFTDSLDLFPGYGEWGAGMKFAVTGK